jgi:hypothetical protein
VAVMWNFTLKSEKDILMRLHPFEKGSYPPQEQETEECDYVYRLSHSVENDEIALSSKHWLEKASLSFALSQCVKLIRFEARIDRQLRRNTVLPIVLSQTGQVGLTQKQINQRIGDLFLERNNVNLHFDVMQSPEFFWENDGYKDAYESMFSYLEVRVRGVDVCGCCLLRALLFVLLTTTPSLLSRLSPARGARERAEQAAGHAARSAGYAQHAAAVAALEQAGVDHHHAHLRGGVRGGHLVSCFGV